LVFFFFSSRRRHTRSYGDWSSDVCSSDLQLVVDRRQPLLADRVDLDVELAGLAGNARGLEVLRVVEREVALFAGGRADELRREARPRETALEVEVVVEPFTVDQAGVAAAALHVDRDPVAGLGRTLDRHPFGVPLLEVAD